jgi:MFS family permease
MPRREVSQLGFILRALEYPNYRLFFCGQLISLTGTALTMVATTWLVYRLASRSMPLETARMLGLVTFVGQAPMFFLVPFAGVLADRVNRHSVLVVTQTLSMLQSFALAYLTFKGIITIAQIMALSVFQGLVNAVDIPARQAFVIEMVEKSEDLPNAIALNSSMYQVTRLIGPAVAGLLIWFVGEGYCFLIDGISYMAVIAALLAMRLKPHRLDGGGRNPLLALKDGLVYAFGFGPIRILLLMVAAVSLWTVPTSVLMPIFAAQVLGGRSGMYGLLLSAVGVGALAGTIYLASRRTVVGLGRIIALAGVALGLAMIGFAASRWLWLSLPLLMVTGGSFVVLAASCNTLLQTIVDDDKRGRVMSLFAMCMVGVAPFAGLVGGYAAQYIGAPRTVAIAGAACMVSGAVFASKLKTLRPLIRPIYIRKGILPAVALGVEAAAKG